MDFLSRDLIIYQLRQEIAQLKLALERREREVSFVISTDFQASSF